MYASIAAVGSCSKSFNFNPAISAAFFVAAICLSLKEAGTVTTAFVTFLLVYFLKMRINLVNDSIIKFYKIIIIYAIRFILVSMD